MCKWRIGIELGKWQNTGITKGCHIVLRVIISANEASKNESRKVTIDILPFMHSIFNNMSIYWTVFVCVAPQ